MNHVVIIGFMGSGKTRVGKQLSKDLGLSFVDLERLITRKMNISGETDHKKDEHVCQRDLSAVW